jgi:hypothetical protein
MQSHVFVEADLLHLLTLLMLLLLPVTGMTLTMRLTGLSAHDGRMLCWQYGELQVMGTLCSCVSVARVTRTGGQHYEDHACCSATININCIVQCMPCKMANGLRVTPHSLIDIECCLGTAHRRQLW